MDIKITTNNSKILLNGDINKRISEFHFGLCSSLPQEAQDVKESMGANHTEMFQETDLLLL